VIAGRRDHAVASDAELSTTIRAFVACPLPGDARRLAIDLQQRFQRAGLPLRPTPENVLHVTAFFIGAVEYGRALEFWEKAVPAMEHLRPSFQRTAGVICLPEGPSPRVVCLRLEGDPGLRRLHGLLADAATRSGIRVDRRPFLAHATIARVRQPSPPNLGGVVGRLHDELAFAPRDPEPCDRVILYRSDLGPGGPRYTELSSTHLGGTAG